MKHIIQNFEQLATSSLRKQALTIAEAGFEAVNTTKIVERQFLYNSRKQILKIQNQTFDLKNFEKVICVGFGKAALEAVTAIQSILQTRISCGFVIDLKEGSLGNIVCRVGTHPFPTQVNVQATKELVAMLETSTKKDLVIVVVSGGGSSLLCYPHDLSCQAQTDLTKTLMRKGADIYEINTVRKHLSKVKGGNLAKICHPATVAGLIFSDVPGDDLGMVASGPTVKDTTTVKDATAVLKKYDILADCNLPFCRLHETPKEEAYFERVHNFLMVSSKTALKAMEEQAEDLGWKVKIYSESFQGLAKELGPKILQNASSRQCLLGAGESTVKVTGKGVGGRNQEMALAALPHIKEGEVFVTLASDGYDNTEAAGAVADFSTLARAKTLGLNPQHYLEDNDSYMFFKELSDGVFTGLTGSNISDFFVCLKN